MKHLYPWLRNATPTIFIAAISIILASVPTRAALFPSNNDQATKRSLMPALVIRPTSDKKTPPPKPSLSTLIKRRTLLAVSLVKLNNLMLLAASRAGNTARIIKALDKGAKINIYNTQLQTPLMVAIQSGDIPSIQLLLDRGASTSLRDKIGNNARDYAQQSGNQEIIKLFVPTNNAPQENVSNHALQEIRSDSSLDEKEDI